MFKLEYERRKKGLTQLQLGAAAHVDSSYISRAESKGVMYSRQLERVAAALGWVRDPHDLLEEVE